MNNRLTVRDVSWLKVYWYVDYADYQKPEVRRMVKVMVVDALDPKVLKLRLQDVETEEVIETSSSHSYCYFEEVDAEYLRRKRQWIEVDIERAKRKLEALDAVMAHPQFQRAP